MKALPKRKGNFCRASFALHLYCLNESPSEKEGKFNVKPISAYEDSLNESPSEKEGKLLWALHDWDTWVWPQ